MKKRITAVLLIIPMILSAAACNKRMYVGSFEFPCSSENTYSVACELNSYLDGSETVDHTEDVYLKGCGSDVCLPSDRSEGEEMSFLLYNLDECKVLAESGAMKVLYPASTTKLMTAYLAITMGNPSDEVVIGKNAVNIVSNGASACGFAVGDKIRMDHLITAMLVCSGNDAAVAIAEHISGSDAEFVKLMNQEMKRLGGVDTNFVNSHGLQNTNHRTSPYDLYLVINRLRELPAFMEAISKVSYQVSLVDKNGKEKSLSMESTNLFLTGAKPVPEHITVLGGKTGTTNAAGCCLTLLFQDEKKRTYVAEVFHAKDYDALYDKMTRLLELAAKEE